MVDIPIHGQEEISALITDNARLRAENERLRNYHSRIEGLWIAFKNEGDEYDEGYDDGLKAACDLARAALDDAYLTTLIADIEGEG